MPVKELVDEHLRGEYHELPRAFTHVLARVEKGHKFNDIPETYRMGKGHETFFFDKCGYLILRFNELIDEMLERGYEAKEEFYGSVLKSCEAIPAHLCNTWEPTEEALAISRARIKERLDGNRA